MLRLRCLPALATACALALGLLAGCGDDDQPAGRSATVPAGEPVSVTATEYAFDPSTVVVDGGGGKLELELDNRGSLAHNLHVLRGADDLGGTPTFQGGESETATVDLAPGSYRLVCTVGNHEELGMVGDLEVR